jgi:hypothetical protein
LGAAVRPQADASLRRAPWPLPPDIGPGSARTGGAAGTPLPLSLSPPPSLPTSVPSSLSSFGLAEACGAAQHSRLDDLTSEVDASRLARLGSLTHGTSFTKKGRQSASGEGRKSPGICPGARTDARLPHTFCSTSRRRLRSRPAHGLRSRVVSESSQLLPTACTLRLRLSLAQSSIGLPAAAGPGPAGPAARIGGPGCADTKHRVHPATSREETKPLLHTSPPPPSCPFRSGCVVVDSEAGHGEGSMGGWRTRMRRPWQDGVRCYEGYGGVMLRISQISQPYPTLQVGVAARGPRVAGHGASRVTTRIRRAAGEARFQRIPAFLRPKTARPERCADLIVGHVGKFLT